MRLKRLECTGFELTDLSPLRGMPLTHVAFAKSSVADLTPLHDCPTLVEVIAKNTKVTPAGIAALRKAIPNCKIVWDDPAKAMPAGGE
jgi:hypothetical protein